MEGEYVRITTSVTNVRIMKLTTTVRLCVGLRRQNTHNPDIKPSLLLQHLSLRTEKCSGEPDRSVHRYWIIVPLLGRRCVQSNIHSAEGEPPRVWALLVLNCWRLCGLYTGDGMTQVWWRCACSNTQAACAYSICYADKSVYSFVHSILWLFVNIRPRLIFSWLVG